MWQLVHIVLVDMGYIILHIGRDQSDLLATRAVAD